MAESTSHYFTAGLRATKNSENNIGGLSLAFSLSAADFFDVGITIFSFISLKRTLIKVLLKIKPSETYLQWLFLMI